MHEEAGRIDEAYGVMQEVAIETYGALTRHEKLFFIEEQVRLCHEEGLPPALILSRKINPRAFDELIDKEKKEAEKATVMAKKETELSEKEREELRAEKVKKRDKWNTPGILEPTDEGVPSLETLKLRYYELMVEYYSHSDEYLEQCRCYQNILECAEVKNDRERWVPTLKKIVWLVCLSKHLTDATEHFTRKAKGNLKLSDLPTHEALVKQFCTKEIIHWTTLQEKYASELVAETEIFGGEDGQAPTI